MKSTMIPRIEELHLIDYIDVVNLSDRDREIARTYITEHPTYTALGEKYGISHERVRQILIKFAKKAQYYYRKAHKAK